MLEFTPLLQHSVNAHGIFCTVLSKAAGRLKKELSKDKELAALIEKVVSNVKT